MTAVLETAKLLHRNDIRSCRTHLVVTTNGETGGVRGSYASRTLPGDLTVAVEVGPTEAEYCTRVSGGPIVGFSDELHVYDKDVTHRSMANGHDLGVSPRAAVVVAFGSDACHAEANESSPRAALVCLPTLRTHGYELIPREVIPAIINLLTTFLRQPRA